MLGKKNMIPAFWYSSNNFGDAVTPYLIKKISGKQPVWTSQNEDCDKVLVTGSILNNEIKNGIIWGCGCAYSTDIIPQHKSIKAVRGWLSAELCKQNSVTFDSVVGDPVLLMPRFYNPQGKVKRYKLGIIPHYVDAFKIFNLLDEIDLDSLDIKIIDIMQEPEPFIDDILSCQKIISSTLHGIICCHAYNIPCDWVKFSDNILGDDFKFKDYYSTTRRPEFNFVDLRYCTADDIINMVNNHPIYNTELAINLDDLINNCPFLP